MNKLGLRRAAYLVLKKKLPYLTIVQCDMIVDTVVDCMSEGLIKTKRLSLRNFGILEVKQLKDRLGWDPQRHKHIIIKGRAATKFTPATQLLHKINPGREKITMSEDLPPSL